MRRALRILRFERAVTDLGRAVAFYVGALGFEASGGSADQTRVWLRRGADTLVLQAGGAAEDVVACDQAFQHIALPVADMDAALARLQAFAPRMIGTGGPQLLPASSGGVTALKFFDPDGHPVEFLSFPDGRTGGIDHSAIVVSDTARSIAFYRERLGLQLAARQTNAGPEQDRLDGLSHVQVDVVALAPEAGSPHLELLGYRVPAVRPRRPRSWPATRIVWEVDDAHTPELVHDPDGHALLLLPRSATQHQE
jgi:catechol 2,3-dioxygenase-like lactoylglutathione lyase family enzyme